MATTSRPTSVERPVEPLAPEATVELLNQIKGGDGAAMERLLQRCMPALRRWAHGRLPPSSRGMLETADLVQDAVVAGLRRLDAFESRHQGAPRPTFDNRSRIGFAPGAIQQRRPSRRSRSNSSTRASLLEHTIGVENVTRYKVAICRPAGRCEAIIGRVEMQYSYEMLAVVISRRVCGAGGVTQP